MSWVVAVVVSATPFAGHGTERTTPRTPPPRRTPPAPATCLGRWVGVGTNGGAPWTIDMVVTATSGARCGTIEYPSLGCGGYLERCSLRDGRLTLVERYTHNPGTCAPAGTIVARCAGGEMDWVWTGWEVVRSVLRRP